MCASSLSFLKTAPPPPRVALLPDGLFFTRAVPIATGASAEEAAAQIELALESVSPFPLAQLYYGWFWTAGAESAFVFAAYRRRFTSEQVALWDGAERVLPGFAAVLGANVAPATTAILTSPEGLTAIYWAEPPVPAKVRFRPLDPEATEEQKAEARDALLREFDGSKKVIEIDSPVEAEPGDGDGEIVFRSGDLESKLSPTMAGALDVRDKAELAALRAARKRDVLLWQVTFGCVAALVVLAIGELVLIGGREWQRGRDRLYAAQKAPVETISNMQDLTNRIDELTTKRLLPLEMVTQLVGENSERKPEEIQYTLVQADTTRGLDTIYVRGKTTNPAQVDAYGNTLRNLPSVEKVDPQISQVVNGRADFTLTVKFKPNSLKATKSVAATP